MGSIFKRGKKFWIKYYRNGKPYREPTRTESKTKAEHLLKLREGQIEVGIFAGFKMDKIVFDELAEDMRIKIIT